MSSVNSCPFGGIPCIDGKPHNSSSGRFFRHKFTEEVYEVCNEHLQWYLEHLEKDVEGSWTEVMADYQFTNSGTGKSDKVEDGGRSKGLAALTALGAMSGFFPATPSVYSILGGGIRFPKSSRPMRTGAPVLTGKRLERMKKSCQKNHTAQHINNTHV